MRQGCSISSSLAVALAEVLLVLLAMKGSLVGSLPSLRGWPGAGLLSCLALLLQAVWRRGASCSSLLLQQAWHGLQQVVVGGSHPESNHSSVPPHLLVQRQYSLRPWEAAPHDMLPCGSLTEAAPPVPCRLQLCGKDGEGATAHALMCSSP